MAKAAIEKITLIIGGGIGDEQMLVPSLVGLSFTDAKAILAENGIELGATVTMGIVTDTAAAFVVKQSPDRYDEDHYPIYIRAGQVIDLTISQVMIDLKKDSTIINKEHLLP